MTVNVKKHVVVLAKSQVNLNLACHKSVNV